MALLHSLAALSTAVLVSACASPGDQVRPHPGAAASMPAGAMQPGMKAMREMHEKMMNAKTPQERQALMADHMKAMQDGMGMMKSMPGMGATADPSRMPGDMAQRQHMMEQRMEMMQMMMEMMMDRIPPQPPSAPQQ